MRMATCHPDRKYRAKGLCKKCYYVAWNRAYHAIHREADNARSRAYYATHKAEKCSYNMAAYRARMKTPQGVRG